MDHLHWQIRGSFKRSATLSTARYMNYYISEIFFRSVRMWFINILTYRSGPGSIVGIATAYGLDGPGIESRWGEIFRISPDQSWGPPILLYNGYQVFPGGEVLPGRDPDRSPSSSAEV